MAMVEAPVILEAIPKPSMKAHVSCGLSAEDGIEVSNVSYSSEDQHQLTQQDRNEIRLFHHHSPVLIEDDDSEDERELTFVLEDAIEDHTAVSNSDSANQLPAQPSTPPPAPRKKPREEFLKVIDDLEKVLAENVDVNTTTAAANSAPCALKRSSPSLKKIVVNLWRSASRDKQATASSSNKFDEEDSAIAAPKVWKSPMRNRQLEQRNGAIGPSSWSRLKKSISLKNKSSKTNGGEHALLLPKHADSNYSVPYSPWKKSGVLDVEQSSAAEDYQKKATARHSFSQLLRGGGLLSKNKKKKANDDSSSSHPCQSFELGTDKTRSMTTEEDEDEGDFSNDAELLDRLVTICDKTSSLELERGFSSLQERIQSRSFSKRQGSISNNTKQEAFSNSFFEMPSLSSANSGSKEDLQNDSIPSFASLQEFLTSVSDETNAASLEALLFEQELSNLTTEELAELLDSELEKLMREGFK